MKDKRTRQIPGKLNPIKGDHKEHIDQIKNLNSQLLINAKFFEATFSIIIVAI
jgi:hypothetical protein